MPAVLSLVIFSPYGSAAVCGRLFNAACYVNGFLMKNIEKLIKKPPFLLAARRSTSPEHALASFEFPFQPAMPLR
jgi:hypothetical protein